MSSIEEKRLALKRKRLEAKRSQSQQAPQQSEGAIVGGSEIPALDDQGNIIDDYQPAIKPERSFGDIAEGVGEAALTIGTGMTSGLLGNVSGTIEGVIRSFIEQGFSPEDAARLAQRRAGEWTNLPEGEVGQDIVKSIGDATDFVPPVLGGVAGQIPNIAQGVQGARTAINSMDAPNIRMPQGSIKTPMSTSAGAAETGKALLRQESANQLPIPIQLTKGQATQDLTQQKFEREIAKAPEGEAIRQRYNEQNELINYNIDAFIDETGTRTGDSSKIETGEVIDRALSSRRDSDKRRISEAYKTADKSDGAKELVNVENTAAYLNENMAGASQAPIMNSFVSEVKRLGLGDGDIETGTFTVNDVSVKGAEGLRKFINKFTDASSPNDMRVASDLKRLIDGSVGDSGGEPYKRARKLRKRFADQYENVAVVSDLLAHKKRGSKDRKIALEDVSNRIVNRGSNQDLVTVRRMLNNEGEVGKEAWSELQAQVLKDVKSKSLSSVGVDERGNPLVSPAQLAKNIKALDENKKLDVLYGKKGAQQLRDLVDVARDVYVSQPGAVNYSNTASVLAAAFDLISSSYVGLPLPIAITVKKGAEAVKNKKVKTRVKESLDYDAANQQAK